MKKDQPALVGLMPDHRPAQPRQLPDWLQREPLTTNQHILHLLLTVFTFGLWAPVWILRAIAGNPKRA